jgi:hypothetical protein
MIQAVTGGFAVCGPGFAFGGYKKVLKPNARGHMLAGPGRGVYRFDRPRQCLTQKLHWMGTEAKPPGVMAGLGGFAVWHPRLASSLISSDSLAIFAAICLASFGAGPFGAAGNGLSGESSET